MATASNRAGLGWGNRLLLGLALVLAGAAGAAWALARYDAAARFLGVAPKPVASTPPQRVVTLSQAPQDQEVSGAPPEEIAQIQRKLKAQRTQRTLKTLNRPCGAEP